MAAELWARNPINYIRECGATDQLLIAWDRGTLAKNSVDPTAFMASKLPGRPFRALAIGEQGAAEVGLRFTMKSPAAVYPVWEYGQHTIEYLEWLMSANRADHLRSEVLSRPAATPDVVPVPGQEHRVIVNRIPRLDRSLGKRFLEQIAELQGDYPDCILHVHGLMTLRWIGLGIASGDMDLRIVAQKGSLLLPDGRQARYEEAGKFLRWFKRAGWKLQDMEVPSNRCQFNIQSAQWAAENWEVDTPEIGRTDKRITMPDLSKIINGDPVDAPPVPKHSRMARSVPPMVGDKFYCEACAFQFKCPQFRVGSVCTVDGSTAKDLAAKFRSRDSDQILEGLGRLVEEELDRISEGRQIEKTTGEQSTHVTRQISDVFKQAVELAKLTNPALRGGPLVQVNSSGGTVSVGRRAEPGLPMPERVSAAVASLEGAGVPLAQITEEMLARVLAADSDQNLVREIAQREAMLYQLPDGLAVTSLPSPDEVVDGELVEDE